MTHCILAIPGDGIGPEVVPAALQVLEAAGASMEIIRGEAGAGVQRVHGVPVHADTLERLADADVVLFGATTTVPGAPSAVLALRRALGLFVTVRPAKAIADLGDPRADVTIVRELTEDLYVQDERETPGGAEATSRITEHATRRVARFAWELARATRPARVTIAHKATVLPATQGLFLRIALEEARRHGVEATGALADSLAHNLVRDPSGPHLILAPNVFGDILSDVASALAGGLGVAPSASFGGAAPLFEPVHGSAPDIAGRGTANPTATILSAAMMLDHLGEPERARRVRGAVARALADLDHRTPDLGGRSSADAFTTRVIHYVNLLEAVPR